MQLSRFLVPAACAISLAGCHKPPVKQTEADQARAVRVTRIESRSIVGSLAASGDLVSREEAAVLPEVNGYRVSRVLVDVGQYVKAGQTLVQLDPTLIQAQVAQAEALAAQADANALQAEDQANRVKDLDGQGVLSQEQIDQRRLQAKAARAQARAQAASFKDFKTRASKLAVTAPVSGLVLEKNVRPGDLSAGTATPWFRLARDGEIELRANLSEPDLARVRVGQSVDVTLPSGAVARGHVRLISPQVNAQTKLGEVRILLPVRPDIRAGGFGRAVFNDASAMALAVPETAVRYDADGAGVMVVGPDNRVKRVLITAGPRGSGLVQLVAGPPAGTRIVQNAGSLLLDGDLIKPQDATVAAEAPSRK
ncbi:efflux RND transporter periplasmic adaptor subunit [Phenylobacterium sp.]|uniref:efflux RND transporter periplasmic adaptor subunit n=1 Tax=Phenylobacterium sp. TaxID=1871053 RepID=UPI0025EA5613|nr:efflux RND transporter periplasmic adaptor subunit [Phenylobacterium sp.]